jgi:hypothetical protein
MLAFGVARALLVAALEETSFFDAVAGLKMQAPLGSTFGGATFLVLAVP